MSPDEGALRDPYRYRKGWSASARMTAAQKVRATINTNVGLLPVSEAVAEELLDLFIASACSITLLDERGYRDLVNVGQLDPGDERFPPDHRYPAIQFPLATKMLLDGGGYLSASTSSALYKEFQAMWPQMPGGSFLGVPVFAAAQLRGELYLARAAGAPVFTDEDVDAARDLATLYGAVLPDLLSQSDESDQ
jgi:GAF domain-containing protein